MKPFVDGTDSAVQSAGISFCDFCEWIKYMNRLAAKLAQSRPTSRFGFLFSRACVFAPCFTEGLLLANKCGLSYYGNRFWLNAVQYR